MASGAFLCLHTHADDYESRDVGEEEPLDTENFVTPDDYESRHIRDVGGEPLDTENFVTYIDSNGSRFIDIPSIYIDNWSNDLKMWQRVT